MTDAPLTPEKLAEIEYRTNRMRGHSDGEVRPVADYFDKVTLLCSTIRDLWEENKILSDAIESAALMPHQYDPESSCRGCETITKALTRIGKGSVIEEVKDAQ